MLEDRFPRTYHQRRYPRTVVYCPSAYCRDYEVTTMDVTTYGVKRKCEGDEPVRPHNLGLVEQRKSIHDISMVKLKMVPCKHEPSLRRSVLIFNTLKYIENEFKEEGVKLNPASTPCLLPAIESGDDTLDHLPSAGPGVTLTSCGAQSALHVAQPNSYPYMYQSTSPKTHQDVSSISPAAASSSTDCNLLPSGDPSQDSERTSESVHSSGSASSPDSWDSWVSDTKCILDTLLGSDRLAVTSFTSLFDLDNNNSAVSSGASAASTSSNSSCSSSSSGSSSSTCSDSATSSTPRIHDACLTDLDLSLLDFDLFSPMPGKLPSLSAEELMTSLPTCGDAFTTLNTYCNPKHEHFSDDLDHIMQVLVGM